MKIISATEQAGSSGKTGSQFTGPVNHYLTLPSTDGVTINTVSFSPGSRTYWHYHEHGQILQILAGEGIIGTESEDIHVLHAGDTVWCPPGERHWHGAMPGTFMAHTAISLGKTEWQKEVSSTEYLKASEVKS